MSENVPLLERSTDYQLCDECGQKLPLQSDFPIDRGKSTVTCPYCGTENQEVSS